MNVGKVDVTANRGLGKRFGIKVRTHRSLVTDCDFFLGYLFITCCPSSTTNEDVGDAIATVRLRREPIRHIFSGFAVFFFYGSCPDSSPRQAHHPPQNLCKRMRSRRKGGGLGEARVRRRWRERDGRGIAGGGPQNLELPSFLLKSMLHVDLAHEASSRHATHEGWKEWVFLWQLLSCLREVFVQYAFTTPRYFDVVVNLS